MLRKKRLLSRLRLQAVLNGDRQHPKDAVHNGATSVQVRWKNKDSISMVKRCRDIRKVMRGRRLPVFINDRPDAALAAMSEGLHLGKGDMPLRLARKIVGPRPFIGMTVRSLSEAKNAEAEGADYVSVGPVFDTPFKKGLRPRGLGLVRKVRMNISIPVLAIGGVNFLNLSSVLKAGADGAAMLRGMR